jgi:hypothetical protein
VTTDGDVAYVVRDELAQTDALEIVPVSGGTSIAPVPPLPMGSVRAAVLGTTVIIWTGVYQNVDGLDLGTLNLWSRATGLKAHLAAHSRVDADTEVFDNGLVHSRYAAASLIAGSTLDLAIIDGDTATLKSVVMGANNTSNQCPPSVLIRGRVVAAAYCTSLDPGARDARLEVYLDGNGPPIVLADATTPARSVDTSLVSDSYFDDGSYLFAVTPGDAPIPYEGRVFATGSPATPLVLDGGVDYGTVLHDGLVLWRSNGVLHGARYGDSPYAPYDVVPKAGRVDLRLISEPWGVIATQHTGQDVTDLQIVDLTTPNLAPVVVTSAVEAYPILISGDRLVWVGGLDPSSSGLPLGDVRSTPIAGGTTALVAAHTEVIFDPINYGVLLGYQTIRDWGPSTVADVMTLDAAAATPPALVADRVTTMLATKSYYVWTRPGSDGGLYAKARTH